MYVTSFPHSLRYYGIYSKVNKLIRTVILFLSRYIICILLCSWRRLRSPLPAEEDGVVRG